MAKRGYGVAVNDAIKSANRTLRQNLGAISGVSGGTNIYHLLPKRKSGGLIRKMQTAAGGPIVKFPGKSQKEIDEVNNYNRNRAKGLFKGIVSGKVLPTMSNIGSMLGAAYNGWLDPETTAITGDVPNPGMKNPKQIYQSAKLMETINNYWKNLGKLKIRLGGNGKYASGILTKPGTAPTTFNGQNINYITSPKGGNVTHKFYTDQGSEYILTKDGFARRIKSPHSNVEGSDSGLHDWNEGTTIFTKGEDGKLFNTAFYKFSDFGFKPGTYGLVRQNGKAKIMLIDPKTKQWREAMFSDAYPTSVKQGLQQDRVLSADYSDVPFIGGHILEKTSGSWHPGSSVAFIEGLKQGGKMNTLEFLKNGSGIHIKEKNKGKFTSYCGGKVTDECIQKGKNSSNPVIRKRATFAANARKWKHKEGGKIDFLSLGGWFKNTFNNVSSFLGSDKVKSAVSLVGGAIGLGNGISNSGKIVDQANAAKEAVNERREIDKRIQLNQHFQNKLNEELQNPIIEVNGSPIHTNGVDISNRAYNKAINTFSFDDSKYNQEIQQIDQQAQQAQDQNTSQTAGAFGSLIDSIAGNLLNKKSTAPKGSQIITGSPDSSKQVITTNSGMSGTVDDWRKAILG